MLQVYFGGIIRVSYFDLGSRFWCFCPTRTLWIGIYHLSLVLGLHFLFLSVHTCVVDIFVLFDYLVSKSLRFLNCV